jgi:long-chain fatty acid transport protein
VIDNHRALLAAARIAVLVLFVVVDASAAHAAGGLFNPPHGVKTMGRAGAAVAGPADLNALWYNPALLAGLPDGSHELLIDANLVSQSVRFERAPRTFANGRTQFYRPVDNEAIPIPVPQIVYSSDFGLKDLHFAFGVYGPNGANSKYPVDGPQRYVIVDTEGSLIASQQLAVAWEPLEWLRLGAGLVNYTFILKRALVVSAYPGFAGDPEDEEFDALLVSEANVPFNPTGILGVWAAAPGGFEVGASFLFPKHVEDRDTVVQQRLPSHPFFDDAEVHGDSVVATFDLPAFLRVGARYVRPRWDLELDFVYEVHSGFKKVGTTPNDITVSGIPGVGEIPIASLDVPRNFTNSVSLRLGGDYEIVEGELTLRMGVLYESSAIPDETQSVLQVDADKIGVSLGGSWEASDTVSLDFGYTHLFFFERSVSNSIMKQLNPTNPEGAIVVANGVYNVSVDMLGVGLRLHL